MTLRQLSVVYLAAASSFAVAAMIAQHPEIGRVAQDSARLTVAQGQSAATVFDRYVVEPGKWFAQAQTKPLYQGVLYTFNPLINAARTRSEAPPHSVALARATPPALPIPIDSEKTRPRDLVSEQLRSSKPAFVTPTAPELRPPIIDIAPVAMQGAPTRSEAPPHPVVLARATPPALPIPIDAEKTRTRDMSSEQLRFSQPIFVAPTAPELRPPVINIAPVIVLAAPKAVVNVPPPAVRLASAPSVKSIAPLPAILKSASTPLPPVQPPNPLQLASVVKNLRANLAPELMANFELFLFVNKSEGNAVGQRMYVFQKQANGDLNLLYNWPVSTGREKIEFAPNGTKQPSFTPAGYYELDPQRMYIHHFSGQWQQPMPHAMFFNWETRGLQTGLAIHGATGDDIGLLGKRASAGCVRLAPENAQLLFDLIRKDYKGLMPKFAYDKRTGTMSNDGVLLHTIDGKIEMTEGYRALVFIENFDGQKVVAAAL